MADEVRLIDIIDEFISGDWGEEYATEDAPCAVSCVRGADIVPISNSRFENIPVRYISASSLKNRGLSEGNIIIEKSGGSPTQSTGRTVYVSKKLVEAKKNIVCSNFCQAFRIKEGWNPLYVYYYLQVVYNSGVFFNFEGKTSGLKNLILDSAFQSITIKKVPLEEQDRVANMLSLIDDKIAANHAINDYLAAMARQLYDYWFVQFDFPDESGNPYKSTGGKMVWNDTLKREIPEGWSNGVLGDYIGRITNGLNPRSNFILGNGNNYYITIRSLTGTDIDWDNCDKCDDVALRKINSRSQLQIGDIVFSAIGTIGRTYLIQEQPRNWNISETSFTLRPTSGIPSEFLYSLLRSDEIQLLADKAAMGSTLRCLVMESLKQVPIVLIPEFLTKRFGGIVKTWYSQIYSLNKQVRELREQRDSIMPLLMNGQVFVKPLNNHLSAD